MYSNVVCLERHKKDVTILFQDNRLTCISKNIAYNDKKHYLEIMESYRRVKKKPWSTALQKETDARLDLATNRRYWGKDGV